MIRIKKLVIVLLFSIGLTPLSHLIYTTDLPQNDFDYQINNSVLYRIESNFTLYHFRQDPYFYKSKNVIINYQETISGVINIKIPFQVNLNKLNKSEGNKVNTWVETDEFGNGYCNREVNLSKGESVSIFDEYEIELNEIELDFDYDINMGDYTSNDKILSLSICKVRLRLWLIGAKLRENLIGIFTIQISMKEYSSFSWSHI